MSVATSKIKEFREYKPTIFYSFSYLFIYTFPHNGITFFKSKEWDYLWREGEMNGEDENLNGEVVRARELSAELL